MEIIWGRTPQNGIYLLKIVHLFLHVETSVTLKELPIWCNTTIEMFFALLNTVLELIDFDAF